MGNVSLILEPTNDLLTSIIFANAVFSGQLHRRQHSSGFAEHVGIGGQRDQRLSGKVETFSVSDQCLELK